MPSIVMASMDRFLENCGRIYSTKYSKLERYERHVIRSVMFVADFLTARLGTVGISLLPYLVLYVERWRSIHVFLFLWAACELWFYIYQEDKIHALEERDEGYWDSESRAAGIEKLLEHMGDPADTAEQLLKNWHLEKVESRSCMVHFVKPLVWMFFDKRVEDLNIDEALESKVMLHKFREKMKIPKFSQDGQTSAIKCIRFSLDPLKYVNKSLLLYLVRR
ncbi:hypothetical protein DSO57_1029559 [Entomophthora muscae]|uniref:Uncharacterized protein n=1 Tax=Entomophthora muscae TaxID=34485 RepID=A0ACC2TCT8_9FUNG|nr:hypothetical protein DSO57_1029559 [Entomophthora muscae]